MLPRFLVMAFGALLVGVGIAGLIVTLTSPGEIPSITGNVVREEKVMVPQPGPEPLQDRRPAEQGISPVPEPGPSTGNTSGTGSGRTNGRGGSGGGGSTRSDREEVVLTVRIENAVDVAGAQFTMRYSGSQLRSVREGTFLDAGSVDNAMLQTTPALDGSGEQVALFRLRDRGVDGQGTLLVATFMSETGGSDITVSDVLLASSEARSTSGSVTWSVT